MNETFRVGVVELGSRAVRLLVADIVPRVELKIVASDGRNCGMAAALQDTLEARHETLREISRVATAFQDRCGQAKAERICMFGTEALRRASAENLSDLRRSLPKLVALTPELEARCSLFAAGYGLVATRKAGEMLVIDQGAGSMELAAGRIVDGKIGLVSSVSHPLGAQPLLAQLRSFGGDFAKLQNALLAQSSTWTLPNGIGKTQPLVQGSVATKLAWLCVRKAPTDRYDPRLVQGVNVTNKTIDTLITKAKQDPNLVRRVIDTRDSGSDEFEGFISSLIAVRIMLGRLGADSFSASSYGTRFGVAWKLAETESVLE
jgi:exopolyphosphatase/pppGpp-phosphohydrolase